MQAIQGLSFLGSVFDSNILCSFEGSCSVGHCHGSRWDLKGFYSHVGSERAKVISERIAKGTAAAIRVALSGGKVKHRQNSFQVLGIDFDLDQSDVAYFLEANVTPALGFQTDWELDQKERMLRSIASVLQLENVKGLPIENMHKSSWMQII